MLGLDVLFWLDQRLCEIIGRIWGHQRYFCRWHCSVSASRKIRHLTIKLRTSRPGCCIKGLQVENRLWAKSAKPAKCQLWANSAKPAECQLWATPQCHLHTVILVMVKRWLITEWITPVRLSGVYVMCITLYTIYAALRNIECNCRAGNIMSYQTEWV